LALLSISTAATAEITCGRNNVDSVKNIDCAIIYSSVVFVYIFGVNIS